MKRATALIVCVFALSGASGLLYQVVWVKLLAQLLGGTSVAISTVLAAFMGGLALGSWRLGSRADRSPSPLRLYAALEVGIGILGAAVPALVVAVKPLYVGLAHVLPEAAMAPVRIVVAFALLLLPTAFMGGTLPVLGRFLVRESARLGRGIGLLYAVNTLGAVVGAFLAGFVLIPALGLLPCIAVAVGGNLVAAGAALWIERRLRHAARPGDKRADARPADAPRTPELADRLLVTAFALSGFAALGFEFYWTRALQHFLGNTTYAFSAMLTTFLLGLAAGGWVGGRAADRVGSPARFLGWVEVGMGVAALATVPLIWNWLPQLGASEWFGAASQSWPSYVAKRFLIAFAVMAVPAFLSGMTFPLVTRIGIASLTGLGHGVGRLYFSNTLGAIAGSLAAGFVMLPLFGVRRALLVTSLLCVGVGIAILLGTRRARPGERLAAAFLFLVLLALEPTLERRAVPITSDTQGPADVVLFSREDATADTRVYRKPSGELHMSVDGWHIGGTDPAILRKERILAHLPLALSPAAGNVLAVGLGSGITLGTFALYDQVQRLTCAEIVPGVIAGARLFAAHNHGVLDDPRVHIVSGDGIQFLLTTRERFGVISSDSKLNPEYVGNSNTLAREYYELCRDRLTAGGVMVQWLALHYPSSQTQVVARSFLEAFPHVELFWIDPTNLLMAGSREPLRFDFDRWHTLTQSPAVAADLRAETWDDPYVLATAAVAGEAPLAAAVAQSPVNTWLRPTIEFRVVRDYRLKTVPYHQIDNLRWLVSLWAPDDFAVSGAADRERLSRFRASTQAYLQGHASGGVGRLVTGRSHFAAGAARNPEDVRLGRVLEVLDRDGALLRTGPPPNLRDPNAWLALGLRHLDEGRPADALASFDQALALAPGSASGQYDRLLALRKLGRQQEARAGIERFTREFPRDARGWSLLGQSRAEGGDFEAAHAALRRAVDLDPSTATYWNNLGVTLARLDRNAEAGHAFARVYALDPTFPDAAYSTAAAYSQAGEMQKAAEWVVTCLDRRLGDPARFLSDENFAPLRATPHWPRERVAAAVAASQTNP